MSKFRVVLAVAAAHFMMAQTELQRLPPPPASAYAQNSAAPAPQPVPPPPPNFGQEHFGQSPPQPQPQNPPPQNLQPRNAPATLPGNSFAPAPHTAAPPAQNVFAPPPQPLAPGRASFNVVQRTGYAEVKFHGLSLRGARQNAQLNEVALDFGQPVDAGLFEKLEAAAPEWVEFSYSGYDSAVIRARVPARFDTRNDGDGFSLRISPRDGAPNAAPQQYAAQEARVAAAYGQTDAARAQLDMLAGTVPVARGSSAGAESGNPFVLRTRGAIEAGVGDWQAAQRYYAIAQAERPQDSTLRGSLEEASRQVGPQISESAEWRHSRGQTVVAANISGQLPVVDRFAVEAKFAATNGRGDATRRPNGTVAPANKFVFSGLLGGVYHIPGGDDARLAALYGPSGFGAEFAYATRTPLNEFGATLTYHSPYLQTTEAIVGKAFLDRAQLRYAQRIVRGLWGELAARVSRYGIDRSDEAGTTAGFTASLRSVWEFYGWSAGLSYEVDGEYVLSTSPRTDPFGTRFVPLSVREYEVHAVSASASTPLAEDFWLDAYAGFAYDRYGGNGPFGGLSIRYTPLPGFDISAGVSHSSVSSHQGEAGGSTTTAGVNLVYKMQGELAPQ